MLRAIYASASRNVNWGQLTLSYQLIMLLETAASNFEPDIPDSLKCRMYDSASNVVRL